MHPLPFSRLVAALALSAAACSQPRPPAAASRTTASAPRPAPAEHSQMQAPVVASWQLREAPGRVAAGASRLHLRARIEYRSPLAVPLEVRVRLPSGVRVVQGPLAYTLPPAPAGAVHETDYEFDVASPPAEDLVLVAHARAQAFGVHAEVPYRFGRPTPLGPRPTAGGPRVRVGGIDFGRAVPAGGR